MNQDTTQCWKTAHHLLKHPKEIQTNTEFGKIIQPLILEKVFLIAEISKAIFYSDFPSVINYNCCSSVLLS